MSLYFDPLETVCKSTVGAISRGSLLTFNVYEREGGEENFSAASCTLVLNRDGEEAEYFPMKKIGERWTISLKFHSIGLYFYYFQVDGRCFSRGKMRKGMFTASPLPWQIIVYEESFETPNWLKGGVIYQIFPDRFNKSGDYHISGNKILKKWGETPEFRPNEHGQILCNDFYGGNLNGIREKLDYLQALGVTALYLNPIFEAFSNHRYDTGDFMKIDELLGSDEEFDQLVKEGEKRGIRIILDGVFNHTGADSRYFNQFGRYESVGAFQSQNSPYFDWFNFHLFPFDYDCWWGIKTLPAVNESSPSYQEFIFGENGVIRHWMRRGISGFRLDVADELPDLFLKKLRKTVKEENPEAVVIGEVWEDASNKVAYEVRREYFQGEELDSVMNYPLKDAIIDFVLSGNTEKLRETMAMLVDNYPHATLHTLMNSLGTHDTPRILTVLGRKFCTTKEEMAVTCLSDEEKNAAKKFLRIAAVLQFMLPGIPCIYYGDENSMEGYADPFCRGCFDWNNLDEELIGFYQKLGQIRFELKDVLKEGKYREIFADESCFIFERKSEKNAVYVYVNRSDRNYSVTFEGIFKEYLTEKLYNGTLTIAAYSHGVLSKIK